VPPVEENTTLTAIIMNNSIPSSHYMSPHQDVLNVQPSTEEDKLSLIEELKSRGKHCVASQNFP